MSTLESDSLIWIAVAALILGASATALGAAADATLGEANRVRLRALAAPERRLLPAVTRLIEDPSRAWLTARTVNTVGLALAGGAAGALIAALGDGGTASSLGLAVLGLIAVLGCDLVPRGWATRHPESAAPVVAPPMAAVARVVMPLLGPLARIFGIEMPEHPRSLREDELRTLLNVDDETGALESDEAQMIAGVMELGQTQAHELMVPRIDIVAIPATATLDEALDTIISAGHSRIPVYGDTIDEISGLLYAKDLLKALRNRDFSVSIVDFLRDPLFVPESKPVDALLADLRSHQVHMAIVVDEYGGTAGLVTIEDLLEEIVGEIQDEYDVEEPRVVHIGDDEAIFNAGINIYDVNRTMGIHLPTDEVNTLAGLILTHLGRVPVTGDRIAFDDADVEVVDLLGRRVRRARVRRCDPLRPERADPAAHAVRPEDAAGRPG